MSDNFASLGPGLLARKGGARPAMRRQVAVLPGAGGDTQNLEDLGWNDMGEDADEGANAAYQRTGDVLRLSPATAGGDDAVVEDDSGELPSNQPAQSGGHAEIAAPDAVEAALDTPLLAKKPNVLRQQEEIAQRIDARPAGQADTAPPLRRSGAAASLPDPAPVSGPTPDPDAAPSSEPAATSAALVSGPASEQKVPQISEQTARKTRSKRVRRPALERGKRAAFTLRLDAQRHLKLRLACTLRNRSAQQLVTEALDQLLGQMNDVDTLAAHVRGTD
ncbi:hypothetical protein [Pontixanthobacter sp.]|uniref:hypothetical protein n=1 Tax=Pontixanthobacter sp. TaxID=2792078 RepID=UPI003C7A3D7C